MAFKRRATRLLRVLEPDSDDHQVVESISTAVARVEAAITAMYDWPEAKAEDEAYERFRYGARNENPTLDTLDLAHPMVTRVLGKIVSEVENDLGGIADAAKHELASLVPDSKNEDLVARMRNQAERLWAAVCQIRSAIQMIGIDS
ncbi:hypothetical protein ACFL6C_00130 [Myxococcota bacterium]